MSFSGRQSPIVTLYQRGFLCTGNVRSARKPPSEIAPSPAPAAWGCIKTRPPVAHSVTLPAVPAASILQPQQPAPAHLGRLYRSLDGRLGRPNSQHDELHHFGNINTPISASISRESIDTRSVSPVNSGRRTMGYTGFRPGNRPESADHHNAPVQAAPALIVLMGKSLDVPCARSVRAALARPAVRVPGWENGGCATGSSPS